MVGDNDLDRGPPKINVGSFSRRMRNYSSAPFLLRATFVSVQAGFGPEGRVRTPPAPFASTVANGLRNADSVWAVRLATCMIAVICPLPVGERVRRAQLLEIRRTGTARAGAAGPGGVSRMPAGCRGTSLACQRRSEPGAPATAHCRIVRVQRSHSAGAHFVGKGNVRCDLKRRIVHLGRVGSLALLAL